MGSNKVPILLLCLLRIQVIFDVVFSAVLVISSLSKTPFLELYV